MPNDELGPGVYCCTFTSHTKKIETFRILASIMWIFFRIRIFLEPKAPQRYELIPSACDMRRHVKTSSYATWNGVSAIVVTYLHPALTQSFANPLGLMSARGGASIGILCKRFGTEATCETLVSHTVTAFRWCHLKSSGFHSQNSCSPSSVQFHLFHHQQGHNGSRPTHLFLRLHTDPCFGTWRDVGRLSPQAWIHHLIPPQTQGTYQNSKLRVATWIGRWLMRKMSENSAWGLGHLILLYRWLFEQLHKPNKYINDSNLAIKSLFVETSAGFMVPRTAFTCNTFSITRFWSQSTLQLRWLKRPTPRRERTPLPAEESR